MYKVQILNSISPAGLNKLPSDSYTVSENFSDPDALLLRSRKIKPEEISPSVKAVARAGTGVNNIPVEECSQRGIPVFNTPGANANSVKELVIAGLLLSSRGIYEGINWVNNRKSNPELVRLVEKEKKQFAGREIYGKVLGIAGLGAIGVLVANAAVEMGMKVYGYDPFISISAAWGLSSRVIHCDNPEQLMAESDYLSLHIPLSEKTKNIIDEKKLSKAGKGLCIMNFSRGELVDNQAVIQALKNGRISRYVTDFPSPELAGEPGVLAIPHLGASTREAEDNCAVMAVNQLKDFLENGNIVNSVNFPSCKLEPTGNIRLLIANRNIPNMLSQIMEILGEEGLNIEEMVNRHREELAYNIIDLSSSCIRPELMKKIAAIHGVISTRQILRNGHS